MLISLSAFQSGVGTLPFPSILLAMGEEQIRIQDQIGGNAFQNTAIHEIDQRVLWLRQLPENLGIIMNPEEVLVVMSETKYLIF